MSDEAGELIARRHRWYWQQRC